MNQQKNRVGMRNLMACALSAVIFAVPAIAQNAPAAKPATPPPNSAAARQKPPLDAAPKFVDFGVVERGSLQKTKFKLKNLSGKPLRITRIKPDCSCTVATLDKKVLMAGEEVTLEASLEVPKHLGSVTRGIHITCEGYSQPLTLTLRAEASFTVNVSPARIGKSPTMTGTLTLKSLDGQPFTILSAGGKPPVFSPESEAAPKPANQYTIVYDLPDLAPGAEIPAYFPIETDKAGGEYIDISVERTMTVREVGKGLIAETTGINLGLVRPGDVVEVKMHVNGTLGDLPLVATADTPGFTFETSPGEDDRTKGIFWTFRVTVGADAPEGNVFTPLNLTQDEQHVGIWLLAKVTHAPRPEVAPSAPATDAGAPAAGATPAAGGNATGGGTP